MEHLLVCQLLGESWTVFQGYRPWNICWSVSSWRSHGLCSKVIAMEHMLVCQFLGESWTVFQGYSHGTYVGLSAPARSCTVVQGHRPWNICWSVSSWGVIHCVPGSQTMEHMLVCQLLGGRALCSRVTDHGTYVGLSAPGGVMDCVPRL